MVEDNFFDILERAFELLVEDYLDSTVEQKL